MVNIFLDSTKTGREESVGFYLCEDGTTGAAIKNLIIGAVVDLGLSMDDCRGQCQCGLFELKFNPTCF